MITYLTIGALIFSVLLLGIALGALLEYRRAEKEKRAFLHILSDHQKTCIAFHKHNEVHFALLQKKTTCAIERLNYIERRLAHFDPEKTQLIYYNAKNYSVKDE